MQIDKNKDKKEEPKETIPLDEKDIEILRN